MTGNAFARRLMGDGTVTVGHRLPDAPAVSIIMGTYDRLPLLRRAIESIRLSSGGLPYEIVVTDGGSTDGSREWLAAQPDVVLVGLRRLEGAVNAFNCAYALTKGRYVANHNDDAVYTGRALHEAVKHLDANQNAGQVAMSFSGAGQRHRGINDIYPTSDYPRVTWGTTYVNFGVTRREAAEQAAYIQGGFWNPIYKTYAADCELSAWLWKLGWTVDKRPDLYVEDLWAEDALRNRNAPAGPSEAKRMYVRWPPDAFRPDGPDPRVSDEELTLFREVKTGKRAHTPAVACAPDLVSQVAALCGLPEPREETKLRKISRAVRELDPTDDLPPTRADALGEERVLHVSLCTDADPQAGLVRALRSWGRADYAEVRWTLHSNPVERLNEVLRTATDVRPTVVFMQLQADDVFSPEDIWAIRGVSDPRCVVATWSGDVAAENSLYQVSERQVALGRACDLHLHSSMSHVRVLRAAGVHCAAYLQIGYDPEQYRPPREGEAAKPDLDVVFLGSRYGGDDPFSRSMRRHDARLRDEVALGLRGALGERFGLYGRGWAGLMSERSLTHEDLVVPLADAHRAYWRSRVGLSVSLANHLEQYSSDRLHRVMGCGCLLLTKTFPGMRSWGLVDGETCATFETADEAVEKARAALADWPRWERVATAGQALAARTMTWDARLHELQALVDAARRSRT